jgi:hypothetical protein
MAQYAILLYNRINRQEIEGRKAEFRAKLLAALTTFGKAIRDGEMVNYRDIKDRDGTLFVFHKIGVNGKQVPVGVWMDTVGDDNDFKPG